MSYLLNWGNSLASFIDKRAKDIYGVLTFLIFSSILILLRNHSNTYQVTGQAWIFGINFGTYELNLPGFHSNLYDIMSSADSFVEISYYLIILSTVWTTSFILVQKINQIITTKTISFVTSSIVHLNPAMLFVFVSAPMYDFFPKVILFELVVLFLMRTFAKTENSEKFSRQASYLTYDLIVLLIGVFAISIRYSCIALVFGYFTIRLLSSSTSVSKMLVLLFSLSISVFVITRFIISIGGWSFAFYLNSSIYTSNLSSVGNLGNVRYYSFPFIDPIIAHYALSNNLNTILVDKFFFTQISDILELYWILLTGSTIFGQITNSFGFIVLFFALIALLGALKLLHSVLGNHTVETICWMVSLFGLIIIFGFLSRVQINQESSLLVLESFLFSGLINELRRFLTLIFGRRRLRIL